MNASDALGDGRAALAQGNWAQAESLARLTWLSAPSAEAYELLSAARRRQDRLEEALAARAAGVKLNPRDAYGQHGRAQTLSRLGRYAEAVAAFDQVIGQGVVGSALWLNRGVALMGLTRVADAEAAFADGVRRWPQDQALQNALASVRWMRGE